MINAFIFYQQKKLVLLFVNFVKKLLSLFWFLITVYFKFSDGPN